MKELCNSERRMVSGSGGVIGQVGSGTIYNIPYYVIASWADDGSITYSISFYPAKPVNKTPGLACNSK